MDAEAQRTFSPEPAAHSHPRRSRRTPQLVPDDAPTRPRTIGLHRGKGPWLTPARAPRGGRRSRRGSRELHDDARTRIRGHHPGRVTTHQRLCPRVVGGQGSTPTYGSMFLNPQPEETSLCIRHRGAACADNQEVSYRAWTRVRAPRMPAQNRVEACSCSAASCSGAHRRRRAAHRRQVCDRCRLGTGTCCRDRRLLRRWAHQQPDLRRGLGLPPEWNHRLARRRDHRDARLALVAGTQSRVEALAPPS